MRVAYDGITFDSELEIEYYKYLQEGLKANEIVGFVYHPKQIIKLLKKRDYTPDFIVWYKDKIEIIETKGWNQFSYKIDDEIALTMKEKEEDWLRNYVYENIDNFEGYFGKKEHTTKIDIINHITSTKPVVFRRIKHLKKFGWVDYDFKNPNTLANQRKEKIEVLEEENKELRTFKREVIRYISYLKKSKLTKRQLEFKEGFEEKLQQEM